MHKWVMSMAKDLITEIESIGCDNLTEEQIEKAYYISKTLKNLVEIDEKYHIVDNMETVKK